ncbi:hypothetical protein PGT21_029978 [Puccinia graminis f. sp. tritici]|uniref:Transmembrane protein n=1 Tax=Puccinia graminis f. sp. tritici TaxID=56615 RepID=A0A5B0MNX0_PUCGR|nr:hypothetical protein PGT21_029978 [Puccinia graminis f. sp. tritici]KAA1113936.1 hypothetical protein PGTUg99_020158 [Puccinia graminis f. sp. tritici]
MRTISRPIHPRLCLVAILLTLSIPHPSLSEAHQQQVLGQPADHPEAQAESSSEPEDQNHHDVPRTGLSLVHPTDTGTGLSRPPQPQPIGRIPSTYLGNLSDPGFRGRLPKSAPHASMAFSPPVPSPHPLSQHQQVFQQIDFRPIEDLKNLSMHSYSNMSTPSLLHKRSFVGHRRDSNGPTQTWPGTDTVYATKTVFVSQASPATTVYVSNGQIITSFAPPFSAPTSSANNPGVWIAPSGNPNIVVATVTAMSSAHKFVWDEFYSTHSSWWIRMALINLMICFFTFLGFGFVSFGL